MWSPDRRSFLICAALSGCGFTPVHAPGGAAEAMRGRVAIDPLEGLTEHRLVERLTERLDRAYRVTHRLAVSLDIASRGLAISSDAEITRYTLTGSATFALRDMTGREVLRDRVRAFAAYSATNSSFATRVAERDAEARLARSLADQITARLALSAQDWAT